MDAPVTQVLHRGLDWWRRQKHNYRVAVTRAASQGFLLNLTSQYNSIFTVGLGADSMQLGTVSSIGGAISSLISMPIGWLADRYGIKLLQMGGIAMMAGSALIFGLAQSWQAIIAATILASISMRLIGTGCSVICASSVGTKDRVTAQNVCVTANSLLSMVAPLLAAYLVTRFGGMTVEGIRPLYYVRFVGYVLILGFLWWQLREPRRDTLAGGNAKGTFTADFRELFQGGIAGRWILVATITALPTAMMAPFIALYAHEIKGADQYLLGSMATAMVASRLVFGIPLGRLADRIGRKRVIFGITPLWYASILLLVLAKSPAMLILSGALQTFVNVGMGATSAMGIELMPLEKQGRWSGLLGLFTGLVTVPAPILGGWIWDAWGPMYILLLPLAIDLLVRVPLLATVPETGGNANGTAAA